MQIKQLRAQGRKVVEAQWNNLIVYRDTSGFKNFVWGWNPTSGDFPNEADSTDYLHLKRNLMDNSPSYTTVEVLNTDDAETTTNIYRLAPKNCHTRSAAMYFSFTLPEHTAINIEGLMRGYGTSFNGSYGKWMVGITSKEPTSILTNDSALDVAVLVPNQDTTRKSGTTYNSSTFGTYTTTVTNDTDSEKTYYIYFFVDLATTATNYNYGIAIKHIKFTKVV